MSVNAFEAAIKKGMGEHDRVQVSFELKEEVKRVSEKRVKFANSLLFELEKLNTAMFSAIPGSWWILQPAIKRHLKVLRREALVMSLRMNPGQPELDCACTNSG